MDYISHLACECLGVPQQQELESVAGEKAAWNTLLNRPKIRRMRRKWMDGRSWFVSKWRKGSLMTWTKRSKYIFLQFLRSLNTSTVFMGLAWLCFAPKRGKMSWLIVETSVPLISHLCYLWTNIMSTHWQRSHTGYFSLTFAHRWRVTMRKSLFVFFSGSLLFIRAPVRKLPLCFEILQEGDAISAEFRGRGGLKIQMKRLNVVTCFFSSSQ